MGRAIEQLGVLAMILAIVFVVFGIGVVLFYQFLTTSPGPLV
jgi:hypothetical protein